MNKFIMNGTESVNSYTVVAIGQFGIVGIKSLNDAGFRVRIIPNFNNHDADECVDYIGARVPKGWNRPESSDNIRFSVQVGNHGKATAALVDALKCIGDIIEVNPSLPTFVTEALNTAAAPTPIVPGVNPVVEEMLSTIVRHVENFVEVAESLAEELNALRNK